MYSEVLNVGHGGPSGQLTSGGGTGGLEDSGGGTQPFGQKGGEVSGVTLSGLPACARKIGACLNQSQKRALGRPKRCKLAHAFLREY